MWDDEEAVKVLKDKELYQWESDEEENDDNLEPFDPNVRRSPEPGDVDFELGQALRVNPWNLEHMSSRQFKCHYWQVQEGDLEEERLAGMTAQARQEEVEQLSTEIGQLKGQVQSYLAKTAQMDSLQKAFQSNIEKLRVWAERCAYLIAPDN